jgi:transposase-like protein
MGDRFYQQQLDKLGTCPGMKTKTRNRRMAWDDDKKAQAVEMYEAQAPTSENSMEIVKEIADELNESPNGVRMILSKAGVYIKKAPAAAASGGNAKAPSTRVSKQDAQDALVEAIRAAEKEVDMDIVSKLTGKAAQYFTTLITD